MGGLGWQDQGVWNVPIWIDLARLNASAAWLPDNGAQSVPYRGYMGSILGGEPGADMIQASGRPVGWDWSGLGGDVKTHRGATHYLQLWCWPWHGVRLFLYCWCLQAALPWCMLCCTLGHRHCLSLSLQDGCLLHFHSWLYWQTICHMGVFPQCYLVLCQLSFPSPSIDDGGLHNSVGFSNVFACSARAAALCMPVASLGTAITGGILCRTVVMARGVWVGAVGVLWGTLLWLALLRLTALVEGMDGLAGTHCSCSWFNGIICMTDLQ